MANEVLFLNVGSKESTPDGFPRAWVGELRGLGEGVLYNSYVDTVTAASMLTEGAGVTPGLGEGKGVLSGEGQT